MNESVLNTIKKMLGLADDYDAFDTDIIVLINGALMVLSQLGVGPGKGVVITGSDEIWDDVLSNVSYLEAAKTYVFLRVKTVFDPPASGTVMDAYEKTMRELEWRLAVHAE